MEAGVVIVVHGSSMPESKAVYKDIAAKASARSGMEVQVGYMKHGKPTIAEAVNHFVKRGFKKIVVVPLFLVPGLHVQDDIPIILGLKEGELTEIGNEKFKVPEGVELVYARHIGADDRLADVVVDRAREVLR